METCRVCLNTNLNIHSVWDMGSDRRINDLIIKHLDLQINANENLPQSICCNCLKVLESVNSLRRASKRNEAILYRQSTPVGMPPGYVPVPAPPPIYVQQQPQFSSYYPYQPQPMFVFAPPQMAPTQQMCIEPPPQPMPPCSSPPLSPRFSRSHINLRDESDWKRSGENSDTEGAQNCYSSSEPEGEDRNSSPRNSGSDISVDCVRYRPMRPSMMADGDGDACSEINCYPNENVERAREEVARADQEIAFMIGLGQQS